MPTPKSTIQNPKSKISVVCFGEMLIDFVPTVNGVSLAEAPAFQKAPGGAPANVAAGVAKLGQTAAFIGKVGDDEFGHMLAHTIAEAGVDIRGVRYDATARTALAFVTLRADGEREFMFYRHPSADMLLRPDELDHDLIAQAQLFCFGSISLIAEPTRSALLAALDTAASSPTTTLVYDPNLRLPLWPSAEAAKAGILSIWNRAQIIKISDEELVFLTGENSDASARSLWHDNLKLLLVTEGRNGCKYFTAATSGRVPGFMVDAIDTTGAGDAFVAGLLTQLVQHPELWTDEGQLMAALRFANAAGALTTTQRGAIPALPTAKLVHALVAAG
ncbi:MAG: PfkB family carbohydrate kinase [Chloroflexi bacterium]|nr:PfkB family carbohydrate kinase [Chloroflexota bacterium]